MHRLINWIKRVFICYRRGHCYTHKVRNVRTFYCVHCGACNPRVIVPDGKHAITATSELGNNDWMG